MSVHIEKFPYTLPTWAIPALANGDLSGLNDDEVEALDCLELAARWIRANAGAHLSHWEFSEDQEPCFKATNDLPGPLGRLGAEVEDVQLVLLYPVAQIYGRTEPIKVLKRHPAGTIDVERLSDGQCFRLSGLNLHPEVSEPI